MYAFRSKQAAQGPPLPVRPQFREQGVAPAALTTGQGRLTVGQAVAGAGALSPRAEVSPPPMRSVPMPEPMPRAQALAGWQASGGWQAGPAFRERGLMAAADPAEARMGTMGSPAMSA